ncbi:tRNA threonylcarbamoyladenosine biosynthesis protein [Spiroplasma syrphidicola EA-1]|uniref:L-threonylcarbamoyladenylate synthase n=1 Tax=Spiroplasma syrphidicola EA-1 TaxID=1276229 RepID=R4UCP9_9MOLU|nr:Sua5/YciO/YrdC/YwlC family protein [Spiroplasma syrphidicola]AGM25634.1 tRNA threonylcarbamoyladenosine biosynthesis protein [Spiroplasma syrphidicola EA-1]
MEQYQINNQKVIVELFKTDKVLIIPTDTIYGLACTINNRTGKERIYQLKNRPLTMELAIIVSSLRMAKKLVKITRAAAKILRSKMSITIIGESKDPQLSNNGRLAVRITKAKWLQRVIKQVGPIYATSVNKTGEHPASNLTELQQFNVDGIIYDGELNNPPSKIFDLATQQFIR